MGVTGPAGFVAGGAAAGIKADGVPDMALVATDDGRPVPAAAVFTTNRATAAPVVVSRAHLADTGGRAAAVLVTSGNANASTGPAGRQAAITLCELVGSGLTASAAHVLVCQTGLIGIPFPLPVAAAAVPGLVRGLAGGPDAGQAAATAMMTTDTFAKQVLVAGPGFSVGGMAKGAAMLAPRMATMLAVLTTDADADPATLAQVLTAGVGPSFNSLTVDGATSTNDTVILLASGRAGPVDREALARAVADACTGLATMMAEDAEGASKVVHLEVAGARTDAEAHQAARRVAESQLVKCSFNGEDPYWGRLVSELGSAGVAYDNELVSVAYGGVTVCAGGVAVEHDRAAVAAHMAGRHLHVRCHLGLGTGSGVVLTTDLGYGYIDENRTTS